MLARPLVIHALALTACATLAAAQVSDASSSPNAAPQRERARLPNIVFILADDLGYGDVACYNAETKVKTPQLDKLAKQGMRFTDAHSPSTVCTPSRYSLLTGRMCFRTGYRGVFSGVGGPALIEEGRLTLGEMLRQKGYTTACIGKWHIGMTFLTKDGKPAHKAKVPRKQPRDWREGGPALRRVQLVDWSKSIPDGPIHRGFDIFFGTACCPTTDWLYAFIEQDRVPVPPTARLDRKPLPKHPYARDNRRGMIAEGFDLERVDLDFLDKSVAFLEKQAGRQRRKPFFLFHSMQAVHLPSFAAKEFKGKSGAGPHGDFIHELDVIVGRLMATLDRLNLAEDTIVMFSSDNGPEVTTAIHMRKDHGHDGARPWRGLKRDQWEGGHRVPLIVRWPGVVEAGSTSAQPVSLTDVFATCAAITKSDLPNDAAEDSFDISPILRGEQGDAPLRPYLLQQTMRLALSIRKGPWKLLAHKGSGGNNYKRNKRLAEFVIPDTAPKAPGQLYNLDEDPGETTNLYEKHPKIVAELTALLEESKRSGRSAPRRGK